MFSRVCLCSVLSLERTHFCNTRNIVSHYHDAIVIVKVTSIVNPICPTSPLAYDALIYQVIRKLFTVKVVDGDLA